jgi:SNF2 family DNA or RNA helicase
MPSVPTAKSLVFSQFTSSLQYLQEELPKFGFNYRTLSGDMPMRRRAKALHDFQNDPPTTIFLLSMRAGAVGINLTQANRVFLLEPSFNPAVEAQSIGRVYRLVSSVVRRRIDDASLRSLSLNSLFPVCYRAKSERWRWFGFA